MIVLSISVFLILFVVAGVIIFINFSVTLFSDIDNYLKSNAGVVADTIDTYIEDQLSIRHDLEYGGAKSISDVVGAYFPRIFKRWMVEENVSAQMNNIVVQIFDDKGQFVVASRSLPNAELLDREAYFSARSGGKHIRNVSVESAQEQPLVMRFLTVPVMEEEVLLYIIRMSVSIRTANSALSILQFVLFLLFPVMVLFIGIISWLFTRITMRPVKEITGAIHKITDRGSSGGKNTSGASSFDDLIARLNQSFVSQKKLIEDLSHELKTPLAVIKGEIETTLRRPRKREEYAAILASNLEEINRVTGIIEKLLLFSSFENKSICKAFREISLSRIIAAIADNIAVLADQKQVVIRRKIEEGIKIRSDEDLIHRLYYNLLDNAVKYTERGFIDVELTRGKDCLVTTICDTGVGIPENELPLVFDRYYRVMRSASGCGIGLSIVKAIVELHRGKIDIESVPGKGTRVIVSLPEVLAELF